MANEIKIAKLDELLGPNLAPTEEISGYRTKSHTAKGDNFGSVMISLDVDITDKETGKKRTLHLVNKMIPQEEFIRKIFNTKITYFKEMDFYVKVVPAMLKLQQESGVPEEDWVSHIFPKCYGARHGFGEEVDDDAAILLENLNSTGYALRDKKVGLDYNHTRLVMEKLAYFHALPIALKRLRPAEFERTVTVAAKPFTPNEDDDNKEEGEAKFFKMVEEVLGKLTIKPEIVQAAIAKIKSQPYGHYPSAVEPFITISHEDLWVNNVLFQAGPQNEPVAMAFVDFQGIRLQSPMLDLVFFLFTSVTPSVRRKHFDDFFDIYYENFIECLRQLNCDTSEFSKAAFVAELNRVGESRLSEIYGRLRVVEVRKEEIVGEEWFMNPDLGGEAYLKRMEDVVLDFNDRGWLN